MFTQLRDTILKGEETEPKWGIAERNDQAERMKQNSRQKELDNQLKNLMDKIELMNTKQVMEIFVSKILSET